MKRGKNCASYSSSGAAKNAVVARPTAITRYGRRIGSGSHPFGMSALSGRVAAVLREGSG